MNSLQKAVQELTKMNEDYGDVWKMPPYKDSLLFAITEVGECVDAYMRTKPEYFRNREFGTTGDEVAEEAADVAMMLIKALMAVDYDFGEDNLDMTDHASDGVLTTVLRSVKTISTYALIDNFDLSAQYYMALRAAFIIHAIDSEKYAGYFGEYIEAKMNRTRAKIIARQGKK